MCFAIRLVFSCAHTVISHTCWNNNVKQKRKGKRMHIISVWYGMCVCKMYSHDYLMHRSLAKQWAAHFSGIHWIAIIWSVSLWIQNAERKWENATNKRWNQWSWNRFIHMQILDLAQRCVAIEFVFGLCRLRMHILKVIRTRITHLAFCLSFFSHTNVWSDKYSAYKAKFTVFTSLENHGAEQH